MLSSINIMNDKSEHQAVLAGKARGKVSSREHY